MRDFAMSFQIPDAERRDLELLVEAIDKDHGHLQVVSAMGKAVSFSPALESNLIKLLHLLQTQHVLEVLPTEQELTPNEAAERLNVSRTFVNKLIERGELQCHLVGAHKRIPLSEVLAYRAKRAEKRQEGLTAIAQFSELQEGDVDAPYPGRASKA